MLITDLPEINTQGVILVEIRAGGLKTENGQPEMGARVASRESAPPVPPFISDLVTYFHRVTSAPRATVSARTPGVQSKSMVLWVIV